VFPFGMSAISPKEMADAVLKNIVGDREDYDFLCNTLVEEYRKTFTYDSMAPETTTQEAKRVLLEDVMWRGQQHHQEHHAGCADAHMPENSEFHAFVETQRRRAWEYVRDEWINTMASEVERDE
jgi:hypothetical protein